MPRGKAVQDEAALNWGALLAPAMGYGSLIW